MKRVIFILVLVCILSVWACNSPESSSSPTGGGGDGDGSSPVVSEVEIVKFTALPSVIARGETVELEWEVNNATSVELNNGIGEVQTDGWKFVEPVSTRTYTLTAKNSRGEKSESRNVTVKFAKLQPFGNILRRTKSYGSVYFTGQVKNNGNNTAWNADITIYCYADAAKTILLDDAWDYLNNGDDIHPGDVVNFEAICFDIDDPSTIKARTIEFDWIEKSIGSTVVSQEQLESVRYKQDRHMKIQFRR